MRIETNLPGFTLETIEAVEQALGSRLPSGLRGAWLYDNKFEVGEWFFYPIKDERYFNKTWDDIIRANRDERQMPEGFITVAESETVFGLSAQTDVGWAYAPSIIEATDVLLFFSTRERALACKAEEWEDYHLIELPLDLFVAGWLPNIEDDGLLCGLDWSSDLKGMEYEPETVLETIEEIN